MIGKDLAVALHAGRRVYGTCVTSISPLWPGMIAGTGCDFVFIDTEHVPIDRKELTWMCRSFQALGLAPIVRVPEPNPYRACMALDSGASGVIFPYVESVKQVQDLRGAVKFRPLKGRRLYDALEGKERLEADTAGYLQARNEDKLLIVNVESVPALNILDDIASVDGVDALLVGPHDLSINLGVPEQYDHPKFMQAISAIIRTARKYKLGVGIHYSEDMEKEIVWAKEGANFIVHSSDVSIVNKNLAADLKRFREAMGDAPGAGGGGAEAI